MFPTAAEMSFPFGAGSHPIASAVSDENSLTEPYEMKEINVNTFCEATMDITTCEPAPKGSRISTTVGNMSSPGKVLRVASN